MYVRNCTASVDNFTTDIVHLYVIYGVGLLGIAAINNWVCYTVIVFH